MNTMRSLCIVLMACFALVASQGADSSSIKKRPKFWDDIQTNPEEGDNYKITMQLSPINPAVTPDANMKDSYDFQFNAFRFTENAAKTEKGLNMYANSHYVLDFSTGDIKEHKITKVADITEDHLTHPSLFNIDIFFHMLNGVPDKMAQVFDVDIKLGLNHPAKGIKSSHERLQLNLLNGQMNTSRGLVRTLPELKNGNLLDGTMIFGRLGDSDQAFVDLQFGKPTDSVSRQGRMYFLLDVKNGKVLKGKNPFNPKSSPNQIRVEFALKKDVKNNIITTDVDLAKGNDTTNTPYNKHLWIDTLTGNGTSSTKIVTTKKITTEEIAVEDGGNEEEKEKLEDDLIVMELAVDPIRRRRGNVQQYQVAYTVSRSRNPGGMGKQFEYPVQDNYLVNVVTNKISQTKKKLREGEHLIDMKMSFPLMRANGAIDIVSDYTFESAMGRSADGNSERKFHIKADISPLMGYVKIGNQTFRSEDIKKNKFLDVNLQFGQIPGKSKSDGKQTLIEVAVDFGKSRGATDVMDGLKSRFFWTLAPDEPAFIQGPYSQRLRGNAENISTIDFLMNIQGKGGVSEMNVDLGLAERASADFQFIGNLLVRNFNQDMILGLMKHSLKHYKMKAKRKEKTSQSVDNISDDAAMAIVPEEVTEHSTTTAAPTTTKTTRKPTTRRITTKPTTRRTTTTTTKPTTTTTTKPTTRRTTTKPTTRRTTTTRPSTAPSRPPVHRTRPPIQPKTSQTPPIHRTRPPIRPKSTPRPPIQRTRPPIQPKSTPRPPTHRTRPPIQPKSTPRPPTHRTRPPLQPKSTPRPPIQRTRPPLQPKSTPRPPIHRTRPPLQPKSTPRPPIHKTRPPLQPKSTPRPPIHRTSSPVPPRIITRPPTHRTRPPIHRTRPPVEPTHRTRPPLQPRVTPRIPTHRTRPPLQPKVTPRIPTHRTRPPLQPKVTPRIPTHRTRPPLRPRVTPRIIMHRTTRPPLQPKVTPRIPTHRTQPPLQPKVTPRIPTHRTRPPLQPKVTPRIPTHRTIPPLPPRRTPPTIRPTPRTTTWETPRVPTYPPIYVPIPRTTPRPPVAKTKPPLVYIPSTVIPPTRHRTTRPPIPRTTRRTTTTTEEEEVTTEEPTTTEPTEEEVPTTTRPTPRRRTTRRPPPVFRRRTTTRRPVIRYIWPHLVKIPPRTPKRRIQTPPPTPRRHVPIPTTKHKHKEPPCTKKHKHIKKVPPHYHHHHRPTPSPCKKKRDPCGEDPSSKINTPQVNNDVHLGNVSTGNAPLFKGGNMLNVEINPPTPNEADVRKVLLDVIKQYRTITLKLLQHLPPSQTKVVIFPNDAWQPDIKRQVIDGILTRPEYLNPVIEHPRGPIIQVPYPELIIQKLPGEATGDLRRVTVTYEGDPNSGSPRVRCTCRTED